MKEFETILQYHEDGFHNGPVSTCTICFPHLLPMPTPMKARVFTGEDPIAPDRMMQVLIYLRMTTHAARLSEESIAVINWLADREVSRRLFPSPA